MCGSFGLPPSSISGRYRRFGEHATSIVYAKHMTVCLSTSLQTASCCVPAAQIRHKSAAADIRRYLLSNVFSIDIYLWPAWDTSLQCKNEL